MAIERRDLLKASTAMGLGLVIPKLFGEASSPPEKKTPSEKDSLAMQLYKSLSDEQKEKVCLEADHPKRNYINNWWYVLPDHRLDNTFSKDQRVLIDEVVDSWHSEEHRKDIRKQIDEDQYRKEPSIAFFGNPNEPDFELLFSGHHVTRRGLVHSYEGGGFGGRPIFYGNFGEKFRETKDHPGNPYWYQGLIFNDFLKTLGQEQRKEVLVEERPRSEKPAQVIQKREQDLPGLPVSGLSVDQQSELKGAMRNMLGMFRKGDVEATMQSIEKSSVFDQLSISTYGGKFDIGGDGVYDTFQIEGPNMVWYFRGQPHIHCYLHVKDTEISV